MLTDVCYDVCVIGAGPVGLSVALEVNRLRPSWNVLVLEYGDDEIVENELDETIRIDNLTNHHPPEECTNKGFGGTSKTWGGRCVSYDEADFIDRPIFNGGCTWDRQFFEDAKGYYGRASEYLECGSDHFSLHDIQTAQKLHIVPGVVEAEVSDTMVERWSMPTRYRSRYYAELQANPKITIRTGIRVESVVEINGESVVHTYDRKNGQAQTFQARVCVLSAGAQETTRILLRSNSLFKETPDCLGKYYQCHLSGKLASIKLYGDPKQTDFGFQKDGEVFVRRRFQLSTQCLVEENLLNIAFWLDNPGYANARHRNGTLSFIFLMMNAPFIGAKLAPPAIRASVTKGIQSPKSEHIRNVIFGFPMSLITPAIVFVRRYLAKRKLPGVFLYMSNNEYALHYHAEQQPVASNQMSLAADGSLEINYHLSEDDLSSVVKTHEVLDRWLRSNRIGELVYMYPANELRDAILAHSRDGLHQSGTTRISADSASGVVDSNLKVWGTDSVYVCSSSVLPTSGQANPTYFTVALATRLAHHLSHERD